MDPNANLQEQERIFERGYTRGATYYYSDRSRLFELQEALTVWLIDGGFEPDWTACPKAASAFFFQQRRGDDMKTWHAVATVESDSDPGAHHIIKRRNDGVYGCDCTAYRFAKGGYGIKTCKHIDAYLAGHISKSQLRPLANVIEPGQEQVTSRGETFRVHRAFSFRKEV